MTAEKEGNKQGEAVYFTYMRMYLLLCLRVINLNQLCASGGRKKRGRRLVHAD